MLPLQQEENHEAKNFQNLLVAQHPERIGPEIDASGMIEAKVWRNSNEENMGRVVDDGHDDVSLHACCIGSYPYME